MAVQALGIGAPAYTQTLPRAPGSVRAARLMVSSALRVWGLEALDDAARLVASELLSNAVVHGRMASVRVTVTRLGPRSVRVAVVDRSKATPKQRMAGPEEEDGRGLALVSAVTGGRWGVEPLRWGKRVWADLDLPEEHRE